MLWRSCACRLANQAFLLQGIKRELWLGAEPGENQKFTEIDLKKNRKGNIWNRREVSVVHKLEVVTQISMKEGQLGNILDIKKIVGILSESFQFGDKLHVNTHQKKK